MSFRFLKLLSFFITLEIIVVCGVVQASWEAPSAAPPDANRSRPINESDLPQVKSGALRLVNNADGSKNPANDPFFFGLLMKDASPLIFGDSYKYVGFKAPDTARITHNQIWTLPISDGTDGSVLKTDGHGNLAWYSLVDQITQDEDFGYKKNNNVIESIGTRLFTRFLNSGEINGGMELTGGTNPSKFIGVGDKGDVFIENRLEVDGLSYFNDVLQVGRNSGNAEIDLKSGNNTHWGLYQVATGTSAGDLRFWNNNDNQVTFTSTGLVGIGATKTNPAQALDVAGGIKLTGLIFNSAGITGTNGQILSSNGSNINWIDPTWRTNPSPDYIYATKNTRIGNTGTVNQATGVNDLYVQGKLEVDDNAYFKNINANNVTPNITNTYDLGSATLRWENIFTNSLDLNFPAGVVPFQGASGLAYDENNFFWDNTYKRLGVGTSTPNAKLHVYDTAQNAEIDLQSNAGAVNHWAIYNDRIYDELRFWKNDQNRLRISSAGKIGVNIGEDTFLSEPFFLESAGDIGPHANNAYNLGSATTRWNNIFANNLDLTGSLNLDFTAGSVIFQGASGLAQNNNKFFWNNINGRLGLGTPNPAQVLDVVGNINLPNSSDNLSEGALFNGENYFLHNSGGSYYATPNPIGEVVYSNISLGNHAGSLPVESDQMLNSAYENTAMGYYAFSNNLSGGFNTAVGSNALFRNTGSSSFDGTGSANSAVGAYALNSNSIGSYNSALGYQALYSNDVGNNLVALGYNAGYNNTANDNAFVGYGAGFLNSSGDKNVYFGNRAGESNTTGAENVYIGDLVASTNVNGSGNVIIGSGAGANNGYGSGNVFLGNRAGYNETASFQLYIDSTETNATPADGNSALIYGQFYSTSSPMSYLRFNGNVGITPRGTTDASFNSNSLLHIYNPSSNAELDIQSIVGINNHWGIYQDRTDSGLRFWNNNTAGNKDILSLALIGATTKYGAVGIGTGTSTPPNSLLHLYQTDSSAPNAELDIQSISGANNHWGIYQNRTDSGLRFWNNNTAGNKDILSLALIGATTKYGAVGIGTGTSTPPNSLLHLYQTDSSAPNAELDIQSFANDISGGVTQQRQWSMYQDRDSKQLRFWNAFAGSFAITDDAYAYDLNSPYNNLLMLTDNGRIGIGMKSGDSPEGRLEIHSVNGNALTLSSYNSDFTEGGGNAINFVSVKTKADGHNDKGMSTQLISKFADGSSNPTFGIKLPDPTTGALSDKAIFTNPIITFKPSERTIFEAKVDINGGQHGDTTNDYTLAVNGSIHGHEYFAGDNSQGATAGVCVSKVTGTGTVQIRMVFKNGLYICSCESTSLTCPPKCYDCEI